MEISVPIYQRKQHGVLRWTTLGLGPHTREQEGRNRAKMQQRMADSMRDAFRLLHPAQLEQLELSRGVELRRETLEFSLRGSGERQRIHGVFPIIIEPRWANANDQLLVAYHPLRQADWFPFDPARALTEQAALWFQRVWKGLVDWQIEELRSNEQDSLHIISLNIKPRTLLSRIREEREAQQPDMARLGGKKRRGGMRVLPELGEDETALALGGSLSGGMPREPYRGQLQQLVTGKRKTSALLVGPSGVGKTTLVHRLVHDMLDADDWPSHRNMSNINHMWHISGRRLIAGMSFIGQWEQRCVELLEDVRDRQIVLHVEDIAAWGRIGRSRESDRSLTDFFRGPIARGEVIVVGTCTPEALQQLEDDAPGFTAAFTRLYISPTAISETMAMMLHEARALEATSSVEFGPLAYRAIVELGGSLFRTTAFPGKALDLLRALGRSRQHELDSAQTNTMFAPPRPPRAPVSSGDVIRMLSRRTGIPSLLLTREEPLRREHVHALFSDRVMGQPEAVDIAADLVMRIKSGATEARRPYGVFLFTGPTGTGKTELAKTIAAYLYGDAQRMIRLDMSEFATAHSASRLIGDRWQPDGVLTTPVRQQPFCVVLLDEIEKAHRSVLNLMLQVFDEGRLTDASGGVADFSHAVIIMTSNLGAKPGADIGFGEERVAQSQLKTLRAVQGFFAPELFNRIDHVVPFRPITATVARRIGERALRQVLGRRGLTERHIFVQPTEAVIDAIRDEGFDPRDGARSLRRFLDRHITTRLATDITRQRYGQLRVVRLYRHDGAFHMHHEVLDEAEPTLDTVESVLDAPIARLEALLADELDFLDALPDAEVVADLSRQFDAHLAALNRGEVARAAAAYDTDRARARFLEAGPTARAYMERERPDLAESADDDFERLMAAVSYLHTVGVSREPPGHTFGESSDTLQGLDAVRARLARAYFLRYAVAAPYDPTRHAVYRIYARVGHGEADRGVRAREPDLLTMLTRPRDDRSPTPRVFFTDAGERYDDPEHIPVTERVEVVIERRDELYIRDVAALERGCYVRRRLGGVPEVVRVDWASAQAFDSPGAVLDDLLARRERFETALESGAHPLPENPDSLLPIVRQYQVTDSGAIEVEDFTLAVSLRRDLSVQALNDELDIVRWATLARQVKAQQAARTTSGAEETTDG